MMNKQLATVVATLSLLVSTGGCSGMKNFLFGRGAACGSCATANPTYGIAPPADPGCGYEPAPGPFSRLRGGCGNMNGQQTCNAGPDCECGDATGAYMPSNVDYYGAGVNDPYAQGGEVIQDQVIGNGYTGYPGNSYPTAGQVVPDSGFVPRPSINNGPVVQPNN